MTKLERLQKRLTKLQVELDELDQQIKLEEQEIAEIQTEIDVRNEIAAGVN